MPQSQNMNHFNNELFKFWMGIGTIFSSKLKKKGLSGTVHTRKCHIGIFGMEDISGQSCYDHNKRIGNGKPKCDIMYQIQMF